MDARKNATVYVVDDDGIVRHALSVLIRSIGLNVVHCASAMEFLEAYRPGPLGCVVSDMIMPGMSGVAMQQAMTERRIGIPVIFMSGRSDISTAVQAMKAGAVDFLEKPVNSQRLLDCIEQALKRCAVEKCEREAAERFQLACSSLSYREREIMRMLIAGQSNKDIAQHLGLSCKTIETHRGKLLKKMQAGSLADLVRIGLKFAKPE